MMQYIKLTSLTWWGSIVPIVAGVFIAAEPIHGMASLSMTASNIFGGASAFTLINAGLVGVGLRKAMG